MQGVTVVTIVTIVIFNVATIALLRFALREVDLKAAVAEKAEAAKPEAAGQTGQPAATDISYSRVAGMVGAIVLATFFWGVGNAVIYHAINSPDQVASMLQGVSTFIVGGASMFLPYAANQLRETFKPRA